MRQSGFALPVLLWLIAGMSLLATAVIQFARDDIRMSEQRLDEARVSALARGVALLAVSDSLQNLSQGGSELAQDENLETIARGWWAGVSDDRLFAKRYEVGGYISDVVLVPGNAYVSLNDASESELGTLLREIGKVSEESAKVLAGNIVGYRSGHQTEQNAGLNEIYGFAYVEELLSVPGMRRPLYDRLKYFVHPYATGPLDLDIASSPLQRAFLNGEARVNGGRGSSDARSGNSELTLQALYAAEARRRASNDTQVATIEVHLPSRSKSFQRVMILGSQPRIVRVESPVFGGRPDLASVGLAL